MYLNKFEINQLVDFQDPIIQKSFGDNGYYTLNVIMNTLRDILSKEQGSIELNWMVRPEEDIIGEIVTKTIDEKDYFEISGIRALPFEGTKKSDISLKNTEDLYRYGYHIDLQELDMNVDGKSLKLPIIDEKYEVNGWEFLDEIAGFMNKKKCNIKISFCLKKVSKKILLKKFNAEFAESISYLSDSAPNYSDKNNIAPISQYFTLDDEVVKEVNDESNRRGSDQLINSEHLRNIERYRDYLFFDEWYQCSLVVYSNSQADSLMSANLIGGLLFNDLPFECIKCSDIDKEDLTEHNNNDILLNSLYPKKIVEKWFQIPFVPDNRPKHYHFSSDKHFDENQSSIINAHIINSGKDVVIKPNVLTKHMFVSGATGQGKTKTLFNILDRLANESEINFLILECAKKEHRALKTISNSKLSQLKVITPGNESIWPLRINLFEPIGYKDGYYNKPIIHHIYLLEQVFTSALPMPGNLPLILIKGLKKVYTDKGWSLLGVNEGKLLLPTINDLVKAMSEIIESLDYHSEYKSNLKTMFEVRFARLAEDLMGQILIGDKTTPGWDYLFNNPVLIELEGLHEDNISLISMFVILMLYEYRKNTAIGKSGLKHVLVIEEAHVILESSSSNSSEEAFNPKEKASKLIEKLLAEIRALGEGIVISDQAPATIPQGVIRNTRTKIIHQISYPHDKSIICEALGLDESKEALLSRLHVGYALMTSDDYTYPVQIKSVVDNSIIDAEPMYDRVLAELQQDEEEYKASIDYMYNYIYDYIKVMKDKFNRIIEVDMLLKELSDDLGLFDQTSISSNLDLRIQFKKNKILFSDLVNMVIDDNLASLEINRMRILDSLCSNIETDEFIQLRRSLRLIVDDILYFDKCKEI